MINIDNSQEDRLKLTNPIEQKHLERQKRNKRKSKVFHNNDSVTYIKIFILYLGRRP